MKTKPFVVRQVGALVLALLAVAAFAAAQPIGGYYTAESIANLRRNCDQYPGIIFSRSFPVPRHLPGRFQLAWPTPCGSPKQLSVINDHLQVPITISTKNQKLQTMD